MRLVVVALALFANALLSAEDAARLQWSLHKGDRYTFSLSSTIDMQTEVTSGGSHKGHYEAAVAGEVRVDSVDDAGDALGLITFTQIHAKAKIDDHKFEKNLTEGDLHKSEIQAKLSRLGGMTIDPDDLNALAPATGLALHFAGLWLKLADAVLKDGQEFDVDEGGARLHVRVEDIRHEGKDEIATLKADAKAKRDDTPGTKTEAHGHLTCEFNVTQGYMSLLDEDLTTKETTSKGKAEVALTRRVTVEKKKADK